MWKEYINIISKNMPRSDYKDYCVWFAHQFSYTIVSLNEIIDIVEKENGDLLPISKNLTDFFHSAKVDIIINLVYHLNELENLDFLIMKPSQQDNFSYLFSYSHINCYFANVFSFDYELLLSEDKYTNTMLYLFLFFLPQHKFSDSLVHSKKKIPLISCNKITLNNFEMLLYLMKQYDNNNFSIFCDNYNLNLILLEDFCQNTTDIYTITEKEDWYNILPTDKMTILFKQNCSFKNFEEFREKKMYFTAPSLIEFIRFFQKNLEYIVLKEKLDLKAQFVKKIKPIKI